MPSILTVESWLGGASHCLGMGLGICPWVVSNGIVHHLVFLWFFCLLSLIKIGDFVIISSIIFYLVSIIKLLISTHKFLLFF